MSRFFSEKYSTLEPYAPGEQPKDAQYVKLNTNESPFPPSPRAVRAAAEAAQRVQLYSDPECTALRAKLAEVCGLSSEELLITNGSDEILNFAFMAFCDESTPAAFPDITYGFYPVFAQINHVPYAEIPLRENFTVNVSDYFGLGRTIFLANPNAPTGIALRAAQIEEIVRANPDNVVVIDEAYVDFGAESCLPLVRKYDNLLVAQTFSKSRSLAGARLGFGAGNPALIRDLNTIKYSTNPYNVNSITAAMGIGVLEDEDYTRRNCAAIMDNRAYTVSSLKALGFSVTDSLSNFIFVRNERIGGEELYRKLRERGVLVRHFSKPAIRDYNRITIGSRRQMDLLLEAVSAILEETT